MTDGGGCLGMDPGTMDVFERRWRSCAKAGLFRGAVTMVK